MRLKRLLAGRWVKHQKPLLNLGASGEWDDLMVDCPSIFSDGPGRYHLFYTGHSTKAHKWAIGVAESTDLFNWTKCKGNPVLDSGPAGAWDQRIDGPAVFRHDDRYYLFYEATSSFSLGRSRAVHLLPYGFRKRLGSARRWIRSFKAVQVSQAVEHAEGRCIGFASSPDRLNWTKHPANPVLGPNGEGWDSRGVFSPHVCFEDGLFHLFYGGSDGTKIRDGLAVSKDLANWERRPEPVLDTGPPGAWDDASVIIVSVIKLEDAYCAFYEGQDARNEYAIGVASSTDLKRWTKFGGNPVITTGEAGGLDERVVNSPHGFIEGDRVFVFYGAMDSKMRGRSMVASLSGG
jgi:predicted GH43/DUF377 family glycosyl hydrolase